MNHCETCKHWNRFEVQNIFKRCLHPQMSKDKEPVTVLIDYGADDDSGAYFGTSREFGCVLWEAA